MEELKRRLEETRREDRLRCGSLVSSALLALALPLTVLGLVLPWWVGSAATRVINEPGGVTAEISLWSFEATNRVVDIQAGTSTDTTYSSTWDTVCAEGRVAGFTCPAIRMSRFLIFGTVGAFSVALLAAITTYGFLFSGPSLLWLLATAFAALLADGAAGGVLFLAATVGVDGLMGAGVACHLAAMVCGLSACAVAVYVATKAPPREEPLPPAKKKKKKGKNLDASRIERFREALQKDAALKQRLEEFSRTRASKVAQQGRMPRLSLASTGSAESEAMPGEDKSKRTVKALEELLTWDDKYSSDYDYPVDLLEAAFNEMDIDGSGRIVGEELLEALRLAGLKASPQAVDQILTEMDRNNSGDIDIFEFVEFFLLIQEINRNQQKIESRSMVQTFACRFCLLGHIAGLTMLIVLVLRTPPTATPMELRNKAMLLETWKMMFVSFGILFAYVIILPIIRLVLGPSIKLWAREVHAALPSWPSWCRKRSRQVEPEPQPDEEMGAAAEVTMRPPGDSVVHARPPGDNEVYDLRVSASPSEDTSGSMLLDPYLPRTLSAENLGDDAHRRSSTVSNRSRQTLTSKGAERRTSQLNDVEVQEMEAIHETEEERFAGQELALRPGTPVPPLQLPNMPTKNPRSSVGSTGKPISASETGYGSTTEMEMTGYPSATNGSGEDSSALQRFLSRLGLSRSRRRSEVQRPEGYDPSAFREAAMAAQHAPPPCAFSVMHMTEAEIPASQVARTGCQPVRG